MADSRALAERSVQAAIAAIEIYNKPDFSYREEAFSQQEHLFRVWQSLY